MVGLFYFYVEVNMSKDKQESEQAQEEQSERTPTFPRHGRGGVREWVKEIQQHIGTEKLELPPED